MGDRTRTRKIDSTRWAGFNGIFSGFGAGSVAINFGAAVLRQHETILRTRGNIIGWMDGTQGPAPGALISIGLHLVPEGTGTTILAEPFADDNEPWFYHDAFTLGYEEMVTDVVDVPGLSSYRAVVDSKAMRKMKSGQEIQAVVTNTTLLAAAAVNVSLNVRFLFGQ